MIAARKITVRSVELWSIIKTGAHLPPVTTTRGFLGPRSASPRALSFVNDAAIAMIVEKVGERAMS